MEIEDNWNMHPVNVFNTIKIYPDKIKYLFSIDNYLCVTRENYSEIYNVKYHKGKIFFDQLARLEQCQYLLRISDAFVIVKSFELKIIGDNNKTYPYSAEMRSISLFNGKLYTHHMNGETRYWNIEQLTFEIVGTKQSPYHLTQDGIKGYARHIQGQYTALLQMPNYLYLGDSEGAIHIYETKYLTFVNKIKKHEGPILTLIQKNNIIYATGCDSKIVCIKNINGKFIMSSQIRGQSHDILSMCFIDSDTLVSGGLSTDLCYYTLQAGDFISQYTNRPSLTNKKLVSANNSKHYILINQMKHFQLWKYNLNSLETEFILKFESNNIIEEIQLDFSGKWIAYSTQDQLVVLKLQQDFEITKHMVFKSCRFIRFIKNKLKILVHAKDGGIYLINLKNKSAKMVDSLRQLKFPSDYDFNYPNLLIGSKVQQKIVLINMKEKTKLLIEGVYHFVQLDPRGILINKDFSLELHLQGKQKVIKVRIPIRRIRFGGIYPNTNMWFGVSQGILLLVNHLFNRNDKYLLNDQLPVKKKFATKDTGRVYQLVISPEIIGLIPIDFKEMLQNVQNPIISKKIF